MPDSSDTYLALQFQEKFEQVAKAAILEIHRARDRSLSRIAHSQRAVQSLREKTTNLTEPTGPVPSGAKVRSRVLDIQKDLNTRRTFVQVAAENPRACLNGIIRNPAAIHQPGPTGSQNMIIGDSLVSVLNQILLRGQTTVIFFGGASVAKVSR